MEMRVRIRLFGVFRSAAKTAELELYFAEDGPTVKAAMSKLFSDRALATLENLVVNSENDPRSNALIMVSGRDISSLDGLDTILASNDVLSLIPLVHGG